MQHTPVLQKSCAMLQTPRLLCSHKAAPASAARRPFCSHAGKQRPRLHIHASAWGVAEPFAAPQLQQPRLTSMTDLQRQIDQQFDSALSPFISVRQMEQRMEEQFQEMDRQFDRAFADMEKVQRQLDAELARSMRQLQEQDPGVRIERREERAPGSYRYYESIQIRYGTQLTVLTPAHSSPMFHPLLFAAVIMAGAYAAITAAFSQNYDLTTYKQQGKWQMLLLWPVLAIFSKNFRHQFTSAMKGEKVKVLQSRDDETGSNISST